MFLVRRTDGADSYYDVVSVIVASSLTRKDMIGCLSCDAVSKLINSRHGRTAKSPTPSVCLDSWERVASRDDVLSIAFVRQAL